MTDARRRLAVACRMALLAWRSGIPDLDFGQLYEIVDWPTSQRRDVDDQDLRATLRFAVLPGDAIAHGAPPLKGLPHARAMDELEETAARLERNVEIGSVRAVVRAMSDDRRHVPHPSATKAGSTSTRTARTTQWG